MLCSARGLQTKGLLHLTYSTHLCTYLASPKGCAYAQHVPFSHLRCCAYAHPEGETNLRFVRKKVRDLCGSQVRPLRVSNTYAPCARTCTSNPSLTHLCTWRPLLVHVLGFPEGDANTTPSVRTYLAHLLPQRGRVARTRIPKGCAYAQHVPFGEEGEQTQHLRWCTWHRRCYKPPICTQPFPEGMRVAPKVSATRPFRGRR